ncbi:PREDICTED: uncharacterized protein LOC104700258 [Camelina sativa]|uniref:Uncharacterized protein LOC104700258 n=1 Tax=Camelina sativa TaxID=90675 RepID=A0ABM0SP20_CAMSA|nr:PREDICTED: uncharacterized protein LOC104700258 [Camelina sativa]
MSFMLINPDYPDVLDFVEKLSKDGLKLTLCERSCKFLKQKNEKDDYIIQFPRSTISDLLDATMEGKFKLYCTIYHIDMEFGWYYFTCAKCKGTCFLVPKKENEVVSKTKKQLFECKNCNQDVSKVFCRFSEKHIKRGMV